MRTRLIVAALCTPFVFLAPAQAQQKPDDVIKFRKSLMQVKSWSARHMGLMVKGEQPYDQAAFAKYAQMLEMISRVHGEAFPAGSEKGASESTRARPEIWSDGAKFKAVSDQFQSTTAKLVEASKVGTLDAVRPAFAAVAKTCSGCHDTYRVK